VFSLQIVVKSQILAGGRGLGTFKSGLQGGVHIVKAEEAELIASKCVLYSKYLNSLCIAGLLWLDEGKQTITILPRIS
jgi:succinyl-CoA synthetase beta subunit